MKIRKDYFRWTILTLLLMNLFSSVFAKDIIKEAPLPKDEKFEPDKNINGKDEIMASFEECDGILKTNKIFMLFFTIEADTHWNEWKLTESWYETNDKEHFIIQQIDHNSSCDQYKNLKVNKWILGKEIDFQYLTDSGGQYKIFIHAIKNNHIWTVKMTSEYKDYDKAPVIKYTYKQVDKMEFKYSRIKVY